MADIPAAPLEGTSDTSTEERPMLTMTEDDGGGGLQFSLLSSFSSAVVNAQRLGVLSVGVEDGNDEAVGATDDAVVTSDVNGTLSAKLRGLVKWAFERMPSAIGQNAKADSLSVTVASDDVVEVQGDAAEDDAVSGNPVLAGGRYDSTARSLDDGDVGAIAVDDAGRVIPSEPTIVTTYNVTLTNVNTEYSQALPSDCRAFSFRCRTSYDVRFAYVTDKVAAPTAPYQTLKANGEYWKDNVHPASLTLYLASSEAGVVVEIEVWS